MDQIYLVDPASKKLTGVCAVSFAEIGVKERADLEAWVIDNPQVLGEDLLVITAEFDRFEKSTRRLDVLALDKDGVLVVVELKLELSGSYADQQAIRYAAFCSTMTMQDVVQARAEYLHTSEDDAAKAVCEFLGVEDLPELSDRPRIMLAAGSLDDAELTSTVLWLRNFGVDISCIELTPYRLEHTGTLILVPRTIIPIPEARDYIVRVEQKEVKKAEESKAAARFRTLWRAVAEEFNSLGTGFRTTGNSRDTYMKVPVGASCVHYEWLWRKRASALDVCLHFEWADGARCASAADRIRAHERTITAGVDSEFFVGAFGAKWTEARFRLPFHGDVADPDIAKRAAATMKLLIERTHPILQGILQENN
ncbi:MAG: hypothetical protein V2A79_14550 [Planctomycetota bacterium]